MGMERRLPVQLTNGLHHKGRTEGRKERKRGRRSFCKLIRTECSSVRQTTEITGGKFSWRGLQRDERRSRRHVIRSTFLLKVTPFNFSSMIKTSSSLFVVWRGVMFLPHGMLGLCRICVFREQGSGSLHLLACFRRYQFLTLGRAKDACTNQGLKSATSEPHLNALCLSFRE